MGDENPIRTLGDYSKPSHEVYKNTIKLSEGNNVVNLRSDTIRLVQNGCSFHGLWFEDLNQHLKDFLKLVDSIDLNGDNRERTRLCLFQFSLRDQASNWLEHLPAGSVSTWEDLTTRMTSDIIRQLPPKPSHQEAFEDLVMNFILDQEVKVKQLEEYMGVIGIDFMQLSLEVIVKLKEEIRMEENKVKKIEKITRKYFIKNEEEMFTVRGDGVGIKPDGVVIFDEKKLGSS
nr:zinc finger, CCHC-type [Tanacetum cinerariifolium]